MNYVHTTLLINCVLTTVNLCASLRHICRHCARTASGLPSWILNLYWTRWALAVVFVSVSSFLHFFLFLATCARLSWQHSALSVHVKLFCRIVSYHSSQLGHRVWLKAWYYCCLLWTSSVGCWRGEAGDCLSVMLCTVGCSASGCLQDDTDDGGRQHGTSCFSSHLSLSLSVCDVSSCQLMWVCCDACTVSQPRRYVLHHGDVRWSGGSTEWWLWPALCRLFRLWSSIVSARRVSEWADS